MKIRELLGEVSNNPIVQGIKLGLNMSPNTSFATGLAQKTLRATNMRHTAAATNTDPRWADVGDPNGHYYDKDTLKRFKPGTEFDHPTYGNIRVKGASKSSITFDTTNKIGHDISLRPTEFRQLMANAPGKPIAPVQTIKPVQTQTGTKTIPDTPQPGASQTPPSSRPTASDLQKQLKAQQYMNMRNKP